MNKVEKNLSTKKNNKNVIELSAGGRDDDDDDEGKTVFFLWYPRSKICTIQTHAHKYFQNTIGIKSNQIQTNKKK